MSLSPKLSSLYNNTKLRAPNDISDLSGMCSVCSDKCSGLCEIGLSAVRGIEAAYPFETSNNQFASEKVYPFDFSHFNINGRVFGAISFGMQILMTLNRKFCLKYINQSDVIPPTKEARGYLALP